ncbi:MAG: hypothetical protein N3F66_12250 [Spirochaetes bacterium]|nr:hypothetical protein [Spirochaetota bacterium]
MGLHYRRCFIFFWAIAHTLFFALPLSPVSNKVIQYYNNVEINWTDQIIVAKASCKPTVTDSGMPLDSSTLEPLSVNNARSRAIEEAKDSATQLLIAALQTIQLDPQQTLGNCIQIDDYSQIQLGQYPNVIKYTYKPEGAITTQCIATLPMGRLLKLLPQALPSKDIPQLPVKLPATEYSGLIVDTRGQKFTPMLFPSLYAEDGTEIFGKDFIDSRDAYIYGTVAYCFGDDIALRHKKAGPNPYYCASLRLYNRCPVIANSDLKKILASSSTRNNLKKGNIVIIIDRE